MIEICRLDGITGNEATNETGHDILPGIPPKGMALVAY